MEKDRLWEPELKTPPLFNPNSVPTIGSRIGNVDT